MTGGHSHSENKNQPIHDNIQHDSNKDIEFVFSPAADPSAFFVDALLNRALNLPISKELAVLHILCIFAPPDVLLCPHVSVKQTCGVGGRGCAHICFSPIEIFTFVDSC